MLPVHLMFPNQEKAAAKIHPRPSTMHASGCASLPIIPTCPRTLQDSYHHALEQDCINSNTVPVSVDLDMRAAAGAAPRAMQQSHKSNTELLS